MLNKGQVSGPIPSMHREAARFSSVTQQAQNWTLAPGSPADSGENGWSLGLGPAEAPLGSALSKEVGGSGCRMDLWSRSSLGLGETGAWPRQGLPGAQAGAAVQNCLSMEGAGRLPLGARRVPVPGAGPAQPAGSIQSPPQGMLGEAARIRAAGCTLPSPSNRGLKWVKEEGGGPRRPGGGAQGAQKAPRGRRPREGAQKSKTMCSVGLGGPG